MNKEAITLLELIFVIVLISVLVISLSELYLLGLELWNDGYQRYSARSQMGHALERVTKILRQAHTIDDFAESSITFSADAGSGLRSFRLYLYEASDPEPNPPYGVSSYELKFAEDDIAYGDGAVLISGIEAPDSPPFVRDDSLISLDLTKAYSDASMRLRSNIQLRNL